MQQQGSRFCSRFPSSLAAAAAGAFVLALALPAHAEKADGQWHGNLSVGASFSSGNTSNRLLSAQGDAARQSAGDKVSLYGVANYASTRGDDDERSTTANTIRLGGRYDHDLSPQTFAFGTGELQTDKVAGLRLRESVQGGLGYHVYRTEDMSFDVFAGAGLGLARYTDRDDASGLEWLFGEESNHKLGASTTFKQRLVMRFGGGGLGRLTTWDAGVATALAANWTMNTGLQVRNASVVSSGAKRTDTLLTVGVGYKF